MSPFYVYSNVSTLKSSSSIAIACKLSAISIGPVPEASTSNKPHTHRITLAYLHSLRIAHSCVTFVINSLLLVIPWTSTAMSTAVAVRFPVTK